MLKKNMYIKKDYSTLTIYKKNKIDVLKLKDLNNRFYFYDLDFYVYWDLKYIDNKFNLGSLAWFSEEEKRRIFLEYWILIKNPYLLNSKAWIEEEKFRKSDIYKKTQDELRSYNLFLNFLTTFFLNLNIINLDIHKMNTFWLKSFFFDSELFFLDSKRKDFLNLVSGKLIFEKSLDFRNKFLKDVDKSYLNVSFLYNFNLFNLNLSLKVLFFDEFFLDEKIKLNNLDNKEIKKENIKDSKDEHTGIAWGGDGSYSKIISSNKFLNFLKNFGNNVKIGFFIYLDFIKLSFFLFNIITMFRYISSISYNSYFLEKYKKLYWNSLNSYEDNTNLKERNQDFNNFFNYEDPVDNLDNEISFLGKWYDIYFLEEKELEFRFTSYLLKSNKQKEDFFLL